MYSKISSISSISSILSLSPFLDEKGVNTVGERLQNSTFNFNKKHPVLLQAYYPLTAILFREKHMSLLPAGPRHLLSVIREQFWPICGRFTAKVLVCDFILCFRAKTSSSHFDNGGSPFAKSDALLSPLSYRGRLCRFFPPQNQTR